MGLVAPTERERYAIRRHSVFLILVSWQESCYYPSLQDEGHADRSTFLASSSSSSSVSSFFIFFLLLFFFLLLSSLVRSHSIIYQKRRTLDVKVSFSISRSVLAVVDVEERMKRRRGEENMGERAAEGYAGIEHGTLCANTTIVLHRTFHFNEPSGMHTKPF